MRKIAIVVFVSTVFILSGFNHTSAHEVYVLNQTEINTALHSTRPDFVDAIKDNLGQFIKYGIGILILLIASFFISYNRFVRTFFSPFLIGLKKYAPYVSQFVLGAAIFTSGYFHDLFGIELPFHTVFGSYESIISGVFMLLGTMIVIGIYPRIAVIVVTLFFLFSFFHVGIYLLTYFLYLGETITILVFGAAYSIGGMKLSHINHDYKFLIIRIGFGVSLIYSSLYAKFIHGALALETVTKFNLTNYFHFDPVFLVLGAMLVEVTLGIFFMFGFMVRLASIFFLIMLTMSLFFFGEAVWPHLILIGTAIVMFLHGYDRFTIMGRIQPDKNLEPVL